MREFLDVEPPREAPPIGATIGTPIGAEIGTPIGEWWLASARQDHPSRVRGGPHDGATLTELLATDAERIVGRRHAARWRQHFPLLLKLLDTAAPLSIQVHPSDADLADEGKTETWYVLAAQPGANFWLDLEPGCTPDEVVELARRQQSPEALLTRREARSGAIAHLAPGTIHALGGGVVALEFQTNGDTTYRIWDWGRKPGRELHLDAARRVARRDTAPPIAAAHPVCSREPPCDELIACDAYSVDRMRLTSPAHLATDGERFELLLPLHASVRVASQHGASEVPRGYAVLVPAETSDYVVSPNAEVELLRFLPGTPR